MWKLSNGKCIEHLTQLKTYNENIMIDTNGHLAATEELVNKMDNFGI